MLYPSMPKPSNKRVQAHSRAGYSLASCVALGGATYLLLLNQLSATLGLGVESV